MLSRSSMHPYPFAEILEMWDLRFKKSHPELLIAGSPQRTTFRIVVEDDHQKKYVLERLSKTDVPHKLLVAQVVSYLSGQGLTGITPYLQNRENEFITGLHDTFWQIQSYHEGVPLSRPRHLLDPWRGTASADFLRDLWKKSPTIGNTFRLPQFSLKDYVRSMASAMRRCNAVEYEKLQGVLHHLESDFFEAYEAVPMRFCHGDFHPLNIIWGTASIRSVIDWEFMGMKIETYDAANMLGCLGIEEPRSLVHGFASAFIQRMKQSGHLSDVGCSYLLDCMMAIRFAWLAEWFRAIDSEMIQLEIDFLHLLVKQKETIETQWSEL